MSSPFGDNCLYEGLRASNQEDALILEYQQFPRNTIQITGGAQHNEAIEFARRFKRETPTKRVVYRFGDDDNIHQRMSASECAAWLAGMAQGGLTPSYSNEPTAGTLHERVTHGVQVMRELKARGVSDCVVFNWNTGGIPDLEKQWQSDLDEPARLCRELGYTWGDHNYMNTRFMDDPASPLYCGRYRHVTRRYPGLKVLVTEFGFDSHAPNPQVDGYKNHAELWKSVFPGKSAIDVFWDEAVKADEAIYAPDGVDVLWFCRGHNLTARWDSFNYQFEAELIQRMRTYRRQPVTQTNWQPRRIVPTGEFNVNIRASANTNAPIVGKVPAGGVVADLDTNTEWSVEWHRVRLDGVVGFVSAMFADIERIPDPPIITPLPLPDLNAPQEVRNLIANALEATAKIYREGIKQTS